MIWIEIAHVLQANVNISLALLECNKLDWERKMESKTFMIDMRALIFVEACWLMWDSKWQAKELPMRHDNMLVHNLKIGRPFICNEYWLSKEASKEHMNETRVHAYM